MRLRFWTPIACLLVGVALLSDARLAAAQAPLPSPPTALTEQPPLIPRWYSFDGNDGNTPTVASRTARLQMSGMQPGFITNPLCIRDDDQAPGEAGSAAPSESDAIQIAFGTYNPYFDLRLPGDPGGLGYFKVHSQLQVIDSPATSVCLNLQAYTPAGQQYGGLASGPTYVIPAVAGFQDLGFGAALQAYFGQNFQADSAACPT